MKKQPIPKEEKLSLKLEMLKEIDAFCREHDIRYSLAYGTLLGAVRHKGFIPWDDDVDIIMPLPDMIRFKKELKSDTIFYCDVDTQDYFDFAFSKITSKKTYSQDGLIVKGYGVNIDLYPVLGLPETKEEINVYFNKAKRILKEKKLLSKLRRKIIKWIPVKSIPFYSNIQKAYRDFLFKYPYDNSKFYFCYGGELDWRNVYNYNLFEKIENISFEGFPFLTISCYDQFLTQFYGDYMTPPPENQRQSYHSGVFYWKP